MIGYIYKTTNLVTNNTYVGKKYGEFDKNYFGSGKILQHALKKYGKENFKCEILKICETEEELNQSEIFFIEQLSPDYNIAKGGTGGYTVAFADEEYKKDLYERCMTGLKKHYSTISEEKRKQWSENISKAKKGKSNGLEGRKHSEETKEKMKKSIQESVKNRPDSWRENVIKSAEKRRGVPNVKCQIKVKYNDKIYDSMKQACEELNISFPTLKKWIAKGIINYA